MSERVNLHRVVSIRRQSLIAVAAAVAGGLVATSAASAASYSWTPTAAGTTYNWNNAASQNNWTSGFPNAMSDIANVTSNAAGAQTINLNDAITIGVLNIGDTNTSHAFTIAPNGGSLTFNNDAADAQINVASTSKGDTVSAGLSLTSNLAVTQNSANTFTLSGQVTGDGMLTKAGTGALTLSNANSYGGGTTLNAGTININNASALGSGNLTINGGTLSNSSGAGITLSTNNTQNWDGDFTYTGKSAQTDPKVNWNLNLGTGGVTLGGNRVVTVSGSSSTNGYSWEGASLTVGGVITDGANSYSLTKSGTGSLVLKSANTFDGGVTLNAGTLRVGDNTALGTGTITINGGTIGDDGTSRTLTNNNPIILNGSFGSAVSFNKTLNLGTGAVTLNNNVTITTSSGTYGAPLQIGGVIADGANSYSLTIKAGGSDAGGVQLMGANTFDGGVKLESGTIRLSNAQALGLGTFTISGGSISQTNADVAQTGITGQIWNGDFAISSTAGAVNLGTSPVSLVGNRSLSIDNGSLTVGGVISGTGSSLRLNSTGYSGTLTLNGLNTFDGGLTIAQTGTANATVAAGSATALGAGQVRLTNATGARVSLTTNTTVESLTSGINVRTTIAGGTGGTNGTYDLVFTGGGGTGAAGKATISGGAITSVSITDPGVNYSSSPSITLSGGGGTGSVTSSFGSSSINLNPGTARTLTIAGTNANPASYAGVISGTGGSLVKNGTGVQILTGANTYTGATTINDGVLNVDGSLAATSAVTVASGGKLGGSGSVGNVLIDSGGVISAGNSPGLLDTRNLTVNGTLLAEVNGTTVEVDYDQVNVTGSVTLGASSVLDFVLGYVPAENDSYVLINNDSTDSITTIFNGLIEGAMFTKSYLGNPYQFQITYAGGSDANDVVVTAVVPEPASLGLLGLGAAMFLRRRRA